MMSTILVTGASGQLGSEIRERSGRYSGYTFVFTDTGELDITDPEATASFIAELSPSWIINCAAYTAVDKAEDDEETATLINAGGVENIVSALKGSDCRLIHISTDYVFDGTSPVPYLENDTPSPDSAYGRSKLAGEKAAMELATDGDHKNIMALFILREQLCENNTRQGWLIAEHQCRI